jgi:hypothetical protein
MRETAEGVFGLAVTAVALLGIYRRSWAPVGMILVSTLLIRHHPLVGVLIFASASVWIIVKELKWRREKLEEGGAERTNGYEGRILPILMSVALALTTLWTSALALGALLLFDEYGLAVVIWPLLFGIAASQAGQTFYLAK